MHENYRNTLESKEIIENFHNLHGIEEKEKFMREKEIKFTYDSFYNLIIFADDGIIELTEEFYERIYGGAIIFLRRCMRSGLQVRYLFLALQEEMSWRYARFHVKSTRRYCKIAKY